MGFGDMGNTVVLRVMVFLGCANAPWTMGKIVPGVPDAKLEFFFFFFFKKKKKKKFFFFFY